MHPGDKPQSTRTQNFKFFPQLNAMEDLSWTSTGTYITSSLAQRHFTSDRMADKLVRALAEVDAIPVKELLETCELFHRIRKETRAGTVADLCSGHGLLGILFAIFEPQTTRVLLIDRSQPPSYLKVIRQASQVAPWIKDKVRFLTGKINKAAESLDETSSIVSSHACGLLTDACLDIAIALKGNIAVMPCCYPRRKCSSPQALRLALGSELAFDIDRTYRLENAGYHVRWTAIPSQITPMNRIIVGRHRPQRA